MNHNFIKGVTDRGPSRAAPAIWPYPGHGTLADQPRILMGDGERVKRWRKA